MARFQLSNDARDYFVKVKSFPEFPDLFDLYYFCLIAGLSSGRSSDLPSKDFTDSYVENYKPAKNFLIGLLVIAELKKGGIDYSEKEAVRKKIKDLVDPTSPNQLTDEGMSRINAYANGGYEYIFEKRPDKPSSGEVFLEDFVAVIAEAIEESH